MFVDEVDIQVAAGDGGRGSCSFRREKFVPRGGPDGGNGGHGGSIFAVASPHLNTLVNFRFHPEFKAERGAHGQGSNRTGRDGRHLELEMPVGTLVFERLPDGELRPIADLTEIGRAPTQGGSGGQGNAQFAHQPTERRDVSKMAGRARSAAHAAAQTAGRRRTRRLPQRGQVDAHRSNFRGTAKIADYPATTHPTLASSRSWRSQLRGG
jgi:GTP-binding protein